MKYPENIRELSQLPVDYMGLIFYEKSPRYVENPAGYEIKELSKSGKKRVGVFVNSERQYILRKIEEYAIDLVQLHGNESPEFCKEINKILPVIKAFSIAETADFSITAFYEGSCSYFLFDTKTPHYGGSGKKFDWLILDTYKGKTPFLLSGGIACENAGEIRKIKHPQFAGIDLNSKFETKPGLKNISLLQQFIKTLKDEQD